jgi:hypothetical protein
MKSKEGFLKARANLKNSRKEAFNPCQNLRAMKN